MRDDFGRGPEMVRHIAQLEKEVGRPLVGAEIGVSAGRLSADLLRAFPSLSWIMVDAWDVVDPKSPYALSGDSHAARSADQVEVHYRQALGAVAFAGDRARIMRGRSVDMSEDVEDESLDVIFIDADHTFDAVLEDLLAWVDKVRPGGLVSGHDWYPPEISACGVRPALAAYLGLWHPEDRHFELGEDATWFWTKPRTS